MINIIEITKKKKKVTVDPHCSTKEVPDNVATYGMSPLQVVQNGVQRWG